MKLIKGEIRSIDSVNRIIEIKSNIKIDYLYLTRSLMNRFKVLLKEGCYIEAETIDIGENKENKIIFEIISFIKIVQTIKDQTYVLYDMRNIKKGIMEVINKDNNKMFIDLEFTMPEYGTRGAFKSEIVQYGYIIENKDGEILDEKSALIKTNLAVSERTYEFINKTEADFSDATSPLEFYQTMKQALALYQPVIIVWGSNDILMLDSFYKDYNVEPLTTRASFINIMQLIKNYLGFKYDIGLFKAKSYFEDEIIEEQTHDAKGDAIATRDVYHLFQDYIKSRS